MAFDWLGRGFSVIHDQISLVFLISTIQGSCEEGGLAITYLLFLFCEESHLTDLCIPSIHLEAQDFSCDSRQFRMSYSIYSALSNQLLNKKFATNLAISELGHKKYL